VEKDALNMTNLASFIEFEAILPCVCAEVKYKIAPFMIIRWVVQYYVCNLLISPSFFELTGIFSHTLTTYAGIFMDVEIQCTVFRLQKEVIVAGIRHVVPPFRRMIEHLTQIA